MHLQHGSPLVVEAAGQLPSLPLPLKSGPVFMIIICYGINGYATEPGGRLDSKLRRPWPDRVAE